MEAKAAATGSLPSRRLGFARVKPGASALALERTPSVYISVISSAPPVTVNFSRGPVSTGTPLVDVGRALTSSVLDLVLVTESVSALSLTDTFTVQDNKIFLGVLRVLLQSSRAFLWYQKGLSGLLPLVLVPCICFRKTLLVFPKSN